MKSFKASYFPTTHYPAGQLIEMKSLFDLIRFMDANQLRQVLVLNEDNPETKRFATLCGHFLFAAQTEYYKRIEDCMQAVEGDFPDALIFYDALEKGYSKFSDYEMITATGVTDISLFEKIKSKGYVAGFSSFEKLRSNTNYNLPALPEINNAVELYNYAESKAFENYEQFEQIVKAGFSDYALYKTALDKGFSRAEDYDCAIKGTFFNYAEYVAAKALKIFDRKEYQRYLDLLEMEETNLSYDKRLLLSIVSKIENAKKTAASRLYDFFRKAEADYKDETGEYLRWYSNSIATMEDFVAFIQEGNHAKKYGTYYADGEYFETGHIANRSVVVDGSNVAHNSQGNTKSVPLCSNILLMVKQLKELHFTDIHVIVDASLRHRVEDWNLMDDLAKDCSFSQAPAETPADLFLIQRVKRTHCLLVSNDTFREWKYNDPWVSQNIDFYRLSFMINDKHVMIPGMDRFK